MNSLPSRVVPTAVHDRRRCRTRCCKRYFINFPRRPILPGLPQYASIRPGAPPPARGSPSPCLPRSRNCPQARSPSILLNPPKTPPRPRPRPRQRSNCPPRVVLHLLAIPKRDYFRPPARPPRRAPSSPTTTTHPPTIPPAAAAADATMCTRVIHNYGCGHQVVEKAPCATSRRAACGELKTKTVKHEEKCDKCDG